MDESLQEELALVIRAAFVDYPHTEATTDEMIKQALRIGYVRGIKKGAYREL